MALGNNDWRIWILLVMAAFDGIVGVTYVRVFVMGIARMANVNCRGLGIYFF